MRVYGGGGGGVAVVPHTYLRLCAQRRITWTTVAGINITLCSLWHCRRRNDSILTTSDPEDQRRPLLLHSLRCRVVRTKWDLDVSSALRIIIIIEKKYRAGEYYKRIRTAIALFFREECTAAGRYPIYIYLSDVQQQQQQQQGAYIRIHRCAHACSSVNLFFMNNFVSFFNSMQTDTVLTPARSIIMMIIRRNNYRRTCFSFRNAFFR